MVYFVSPSSPTDCVAFLCLHIYRILLPTYMKFRLIFLLSLCGIAIGLMRVFFLPARYEALVTLPIYFFWAWVLARALQKRYFLHGLLTALLASGWSYTIQLLLSPLLVRYNTVDAAYYQRLLARHGGSVQEVITAFALLGVLFSAPVAGGLAHAVGRIVRRLGGER